MSQFAIIELRGPSITEHIEPRIPHALDMLHTTTARSMASLHHSNSYNAWDLWSLIQFPKKLRPDVVFEGTPADYSQPRWITAEQAIEYVKQSKLGSELRRTVMLAERVEPLAGTYVPVTSEGIFVVNHLYEKEPVRVLSGRVRAKHPDLAGTKPPFDDEQVKATAARVLPPHIYEWLISSPEGHQPELRGQALHKVCLHLAEQANEPPLILRALLPKFAVRHWAGRNPIWLGDYNKAISLF